MTTPRSEGPHPLPAEAVTLPPAPPADPTTGDTTINYPAPGSLPDAATLTRCQKVRVPGYVVLEELGRGGMGVVYKARHEKLNRLVALKMILSGSHAGQADLERFRTEAEAIARLQHPNIVQVYEVGEHEDRPFLALEFCPGQTLEQRLRGAPPTPDEAARLVEALARAVHHAHRHHVVHRDLKPANVLLTEDGTPKVTDFGLAKKLDEAGRTQSGATMGTPSYMAPEQADGRAREVGPVSDVYSLGSILYEMLTGRPPFQAGTPLETILQVVSDEPTPPRRLRRKVPPDLETICLKCLEKDPRRRYGSAEELADDLRRCLRGEPIAARPLGPGGRLMRWASYRPALAGTLCTVAVFYLNHLALVALGHAGEGGDFHWFVTGLLLTWVAGAAVFQALSSPPRWRWPATYAWSAMDVLLYTVLLLRAHGPVSPLIVGYLLLVAVASLRFRVALVWFVAALCTTGYVLLQIDALTRRRDEGLAAAPHSAVIFVLSLLLMAVIVSLLLRRFRLALEHEAAK